ncbi:MAG TPA: N-6 DNA methylase [Thiotrichales bacterium]|nr:MAG: type I restriction endonuclease subunit M [Thiotrichales bacterium 35-46-9]HQT03604.1 N-6 DNA methylase [Thiotrichales bacterium]
MSLFLPKVLAKHLTQSTIPTAHLTAIHHWQASINDGSLKKLGEKSAHGAFIQTFLVTLLDYTTVATHAQYSASYEMGIKKGGIVDVALGHFGKDRESQIIAPFELKGLDTPNLDAIMSGRHKTPVQQAWEYANAIKGAKWVLVSNYREIRLYAVGHGLQSYESWDVLTLDQPAEYARLRLLLSQDNLLGDTTSQLLQATEQADKDITAQLYADYKAVREQLIAHLINDNPSESPTELIAPAQKLLDRVLFIAFAEDRGLIPDNSIKNAYLHADPYNPRPIYDNFKGLFTAIDKGNAHLKIPAYNGGLFAPDAQLDALTISDALCEAFKNIAEYDFASDVSVTVLGHIFEQSIADLEEISESLASGQRTLSKTAKATAVSGKRKLHGVVYTPDHITAFIVEHTLGAYCQNEFNNLLRQYASQVTEEAITWKKGKQTDLQFWYAWQERLKQIKVVDPACGSGAFLVAAFDYLHGEYRRTNEAIATITGQAGVFDLNKEVLNNNLFGVDINPESIEITKLSLWLKTAEYGKPLTSLDSNLKAGNSLGMTEPVTGDTFCWHTAFADIFATGGFDVVLGNPPYVRQERFSALKPWLEAQYAVYHGVADLYAYFFELGARLLKPNGMMGYISSSTFFKTGSGEPLRQFLRSHTCLKTIVDFGDLQIFEGVTTYPAIVILQKSLPDAAHQLAMLVLQNDLPDNLNQAFTQQQGSMAQAQLTNESWQLESAALANLRAKLTSGHKTLKEVYGSPFYGIKTGFNEAFVIDRATRDALIAADAKSNELIKPFLEGKDLKKWHAQPRDLYLIAIPKFWTRKQMNQTDSISEEEASAWFSQHYSALFAYLQPFEVPAKKRTDKGEFWWELRACAYYEAFEETKIQYAHFSASHLFHRNTNGSFSNDKSYIIPTDDWFLLGLLNSAPYWFLITALAPSVRGGFYELRAQYMETLPIPDATEAQKAQIAELAQACQSLTEQRYAIEQKVAHRLVSNLCPADKTAKLTQKAQTWWALDFTSLQNELKKSFGLKASDKLIPLKDQDEWEDYVNSNRQQIAQLNQQISEKEAAMNQAVYALFGLSEEEVGMVEG